MQTVDRIRTVVTEIKQWRYEEGYPHNREARIIFDSRTGTPRLVPSEPVKWNG